MKTVFKRDMVAHLWANRSQDGARVASGNFFFTGATLYSYGSHFVCGHFMPEAYDMGGRSVVLVNANGSYSMTTNRHMSAMYSALAGVHTMRVPGLSENETRAVNRHGARDVAAAMIEAMRNAATEAATPRRVKPETRAAHVETAQGYAEHARHLLSVDASRRDLSADARKLARAMLRSIPPADAFPAYTPGDDRHAYAAECVTLARLAAREKARDALRVELAGLDSIAAKLDAYPSDSDDWSRVRSATEAAGLVETAGRRMAGAEAAARIAGARIPAASRRKLAAMRARLPELQAAAAQEARAGMVRDFAGKLETARDQLHDLSGWRFAVAIREAYAIAGKLAELDSDSEREKRAADIAALEKLRAEWADASAADRVATFLAFADDDASAGRFTSAYTAVQNARRAAQDGGLPADEIEAAAQRVKDAETAAQAQRVEDWRNGGNAQPPRDGGPLLRLRGDVIETSWGAEVPRDVAPRVWALVTAARNAGRGQEFENGPRLGHFRLDSVTECGDIVAGCHRIAYSELQRIAAALNYKGAQA